ncbi:hypothetical protein HDU96_003234 [Phlyctochytrium bullatum]|nr:hypothetical protein HDU96_003234 [Phlyctochytrium bullatum]
MPGRNDAYLRYLGQMAKISARVPRINPPKLLNYHHFVHSPFPDVRPGAAEQHFVNTADIRRRSEFYNVAGEGIRAVRRLDLEEGEALWADEDGEEVMLSVEEVAGEEAQVKGELESELKGLAELASEASTAEVAGAAAAKKDSDIPSPSASSKAEITSTDSPAILPTTPPLPETDAATQPAPQLELADDIPLPKVIMRHVYDPSPIIASNSPIGKIMGFRIEVNGRRGTRAMRQVMHYGKLATKDSDNSLVDFGRASYFNKKGNGNPSAAVKWNARDVSLGYEDDEEEEEEEEDFGTAMHNDMLSYGLKPWKVEDYDTYSSILEDRKASAALPGYDDYEDEDEEEDFGTAMHNDMLSFGLKPWKVQDYDTYNAILQDREASVAALARDASVGSDKKDDGTAVHDDMVSLGLRPWIVSDYDKYRSILADRTGSGAAPAREASLGYEDYEDEDEEEEDFGTAMHNDMLLYGLKPWKVEDYDAYGSILEDRKASVAAPAREAPVGDDDYEDDDDEEEEEEEEEDFGTAMHNDMLLYGLKPWKVEDYDTYSSILQDREASVAALARDASVGGDKEDDGTAVHDDMVSLGLRPWIVSDHDKYRAILVDRKASGDAAGKRGGRRTKKTRKPKAGAGAGVASRTTRICPLSGKNLKMSTSNTPCRFFLKGSCRNGDQCRFRHERPTVLCRNMLQHGSCRFGDGCMFLHDVAAGNGHATTGGPSPVHPLCECLVLTQCVCVFLMGVDGNPASAVRWNATLASLGDYEEDYENEMLSFGLKPHETEDVEAYHSYLATRDAFDATAGAGKQRGGRTKKPSAGAGVGNYGFTDDEVNELLSQGVKPWDPDARMVLDALSADNYY